MKMLEILENIKPVLPIQEYNKLNFYIVNKQYTEAESLARVKQNETYKILKNKNMDPWESPYYRLFHQLIANLACTNVKEQLIYGEDDDDCCEY